MSIELTTVPAGTIDPDTDKIWYQDVSETPDVLKSISPTDLFSTVTGGDQPLQIRCSDRVTPLVTATNIMSWPIATDFNLNEVQAYLTRPAASGTFTVDIKLDGISILSTPLTVDAGEKTSITAAVPAVISNSDLTRGSELTIDVTDDADGSATGLIISLLTTSAPPLSPPPPSVITRGAHTSADSDGETSTTSAIDTTGASLLVVAVATLTGVIPTITDSKGNTWTALTGADSGGTGAGTVKIFYAVNPTVGTGHTFTGSASGSFHSISAVAYNDVVTTSPKDQDAGAGSASGTTQQPGSVTPLSDGQVLVTALLSIAPSGVATIDSSFTVFEHVNSAGNFCVALADKIQTTAGAENPTWTSNVSADRIAAEIASFKQA